MPGDRFVVPPGDSDSLIVRRPVHLPRGTDTWPAITVPLD